MSGSINFLQKADAGRKRQGSNLDREGYLKWRRETMDRWRALPSNMKAAEHSEAVCKRRKKLPNDVDLEPALVKDTLPLVDTVIAKIGDRTRSFAGKHFAQSVEVTVPRERFGVLGLQHYSPVFRQSQRVTYSCEMLAASPSRQWITMCLAPLRTQACASAGMEDLSGQ